MRFDVKNSAQRDIYNIVIGLVAPRPIALVTTLGPGDRINAAPFSSYNYLCLDPPIIGLGIQIGAKGELKDTARNIEGKGEFVVNVVTEDIFKAMNVCAVDFPPEVSELEMAGLHAEPSLAVSVPRIREAHASLECRLYETLQPSRARIILGKVESIYVEDRYIDPKGPYILAEELHAMGRMNGSGNYVRTRGAFEQLTRLNHEQWLKGERAG